MYSPDDILYTWSRFHSTRLFSLAAKHFEVSRTSVPMLVKDPKFPLQSPVGRLGTRSISFGGDIRSSESLEAVEEGDGVVAASGIGDSVRQCTIGVVN